MFRVTGVRFRSCHGSAEQLWFGVQGLGFRSCCGSAEQPEKDIWMKSGSRDTCSEGEFRV